MTPTLSLAFFAGILSFLSPCVLPLVPSYLAYVGGASTLDQRRQLAIRNSLFFILGFSLIFIALGASASAVGNLLRVYKPMLIMFGGALIVLFGLIMLGLIKLPFLYRDTRQQFKGDSTKPWGAILLGMAFAAGWTPCIGPVLGGILTLAGASGTLMQGVILLASYALGLAVPFFLAALALESFLKFSAKFRRYLPWVERISGALLVFAGVLMLTGRYTAFNSFLIRFTPDWLLSRL
ncbi:MAG: sulfite exporter TauE/SafE family protein [Trueperaceae bacterium]|nr:sulfite exporter TauE/SafE family protein [Trueperaceae bacterium]